MLKLSQLSICGLASLAVAQNVSWPQQHFKSAPFTPPVLNVTRYGDPSPGFIIFADDGSAPAVQAPLIMSSGGANGTLIWEGPIGHAFAFSKHAYQQQPVLAFWNGTVFREPVGRGSGSIHILDKSYEEIAVVDLPGDFQTLDGSTYPSNVDLHEIYITRKDTILVTANNVTQADLTSVGGPQNGWVVDSLVYEIDIATNKVLFRWSSLEHQDQLPITLSVYKLGSEGYSGSNQSVAWGYFHINAISPFQDGYLISSRYLCSGIAIDKNGSVKWRLQGRDGGDFTLGNDTSFCYQHHIRAVDPNSNCSEVTLHLHDNENAPLDEYKIPTSGLLLKVNTETKQVSKIQRFLNPASPVYATAQGSYQALPGGNVFLGHGYWPAIQEFDSKGSIVERINFGIQAPSGQSISYRAFKEDWVGCPKTLPALVAEKGGIGVELYMSWNGATEVSLWNVYSGNEEASLTLKGTVPKEGFETVVGIPRAKFVQVEPVLSSVNRYQECGGNMTLPRSPVVTVG